MKTTQFLFSGFGGQGILFAGKFLAYKGLIEGKQVSWLPSYGPEMRGGTASCSVIVSDEAVGSPIVSKPDVLIAMNLPSLDRFESAVAPGGIIFADSTLIERKVTRTDVKAIYIPATKLASDNGFPTLANMILLGRIFAELGEFDDTNVEAALTKVIPAKHADMKEINLKALRLGAEQ
ncbi:MAG: 2-oxoacid:ferredoxin oxidoreductase subunit gamma [Ruminococcaceae bacterium]|nr:2-oxoacid:ferredoxin oxidoreductase subunit gamma [Oscillospiraceae bacterium]